MTVSASSNPASDSVLDPLQKSALTYFTQFITIAARLPPLGFFSVGVFDSL
jgi:hypothetical protein